MDKEQSSQKLRQLFGSRLLLDEPMKSHTSWKIGGPADCFLAVCCEEDIINALVAVTQYDIPLQIIGKGSNLLVGDRGIRGLVLQIGDEYNKRSWRGSELEAEAGAMLAVCALEACEHDLSGFAFAGGIPGSIGGAVIMNAGAYGSNISSLITKVEVIEYTGKKIILLAEDLTFDYRKSNLAGMAAVISRVHLRFKAGGGAAERAVLQEYLRTRAHNQPLEYPSCGSVFRNPDGDHAGRMIEVCGLRGCSQGGAQVSLKHGNFIVNRGGATAEDVRRLMLFVQDKVEAQFGIRLQPEVRMVGDF